MRILHLQRQQRVSHSFSSHIITRNTVKQRTNQKVSAVLTPKLSKQHFAFPQINIPLKRTYTTPVQSDQTSKNPETIPSEGPLFLWEHLVNTGKIKRDAHQRTIVKQLQDLYNSIQDYQPKRIEFSKEETSFVPQVKTIFP
jgi:hypothetical protein